MKKYSNQIVWAAALGGLGLLLVETPFAGASLLGGSYTTIYQDGFSGTASTALGGNTPTIAAGVDGGTAGATWDANTTTSSDPDAIWQYSGSSSVTVTSPTNYVAGGTSSRDTSLIANGALPFVPQYGYLYDLEATIQVTTPTSDNHWVGLAYMNGNTGSHSIVGGGSSALSNDNPWGLVIIRDGYSTSPNWVDAFESSTGGTGGDTSLNPGTLGSAVQVDIELNTTTNVETFFLNGSSVGSVTLANTDYLLGGGGDGQIQYVAFGDDTAPQGTVSAFSLTAEAVPEPAVLGMLAASGAGLMLRRRRTNAAAK